MNELETRLSALGRDLAFPDTPDFSVSVPRALEESERRQRVPFWRTLAIAAALVLVPAAAVFAFSDAGARPPGRVPRAARGQDRARRGAAGRAAAGHPARARRAGASVEEAEEHVGFIVQVPEALGEPGAIYVRRVGGVPEVNMVWPPGPGLPRTSQTGVGALLTQLRGDIEPGMLGKAVTDQSQVRMIAVAGQPGYLISGSPHAFYYDPPGVGDFAEATLRLAGDTLLWQRGAILLRLEADAGLAEMLRIAESTQEP